MEARECTRTILESGLVSQEDTNEILTVLLFTQSSLIYDNPLLMLFLGRIWEGEIDEVQCVIHEGTREW